MTRTRTPPSPVTALAAALAAACTCATPPYPVVTSIDPARAPADQDSALTIRGEGFAARVQADLDSPAESEVDAGFEIALRRGEARLPLADVVFVSGEELRATLQAGASAPGFYDVEVVDPRGRRASLAAALDVYANAGCEVDGAVCDDGDACTQTDLCAAGACTGGNPVACPPTPVCRVSSTCDPTTGQCSVPALVPDGTPCDDGDPCTNPDECAGGVCSGPLVCSTLSNTPPLACVGVLPKAGVAGTTSFLVDASCSTDTEDALASLRFRFAFDYGPSWSAWDVDPPTSAPTANAVYSSPGVRTVAVEVTDSGAPQGSSAALWSYAYATAVAAAEADLVHVTTAQDENDAYATPLDPGGTGFSLREAIRWTNGQASARAIVFDVATAIPRTVTIAFGNRLPDLTAAGAAIVGRPGLVLDFGHLNQPCLVMAGNQQKLVGLEIVRCDAAAVSIAPGFAGSQVVECTLAGPGTAAAASGSAGLLVQSPATIGPRNDVSGFHTGLRLEAGGATVDGNRIHGNTVGISVGGVGAIVQRNLVHGNGDDGLSIGRGSATDVVLHNVFDGNVGDGVHAVSAPLAVHDNVFTRNGWGTRTQGYGLYAPDCTFSAGALGHNGYFDNAAGAMGGAATPSASDVDGDPLYVSPTDGDYRLRPGSPAIDAGVDVGLDVNGPRAGSWDGSHPDLGANEYPTP